MSDNRLSTLGKDLSKAKQQALLIEVLQSDLDSWIDQNPDVFRVVCDASAVVYDLGVRKGKTNVLVVGEDESQESSSIFGSLLGSLDHEFDDLHKRDILKKLTGFGLNQAFGGVVGDAIGETLSVGTEQVMEYIAEWNGSLNDFLTSAVEAGVETAAGESGEIVGDIGGTGAEVIAEEFSSEDSIYLTRSARKRLKELAPRLSDRATSHETLQLALEMLLVTALGAPKVIVVKDPLRLDDASLALLAMLVSLEKDLRQVNQAEDPEECRAQTAGVSVVLTFTGAQPHDTVETQDNAQKQQAISRLRMMASRYSLLERLDSDIPVPAVRASTFVGREAELTNLWQHWNTLCEQPDTAAKQTWCLIKGEPGTGKTALANRFTQQIRSDKSNPARLSIPMLRMLNQTGHTVQATGLASLKNSMTDELRRLSLIYQENVGWFTRSGQQFTEGAQRWKDDATSDDLEAKKRMQGRIGKVVSKLLGIDAAVGFAGSVKDWSNQDEMRSMREKEFGQSSQANHKEEQFELLREALLEIRKLADKCTPDGGSQSAGSARPLLLLIDDLQWVDDFTAEFLLNEWPVNIPVYILATARGSDSFTTTGESSTRQALNYYRNRLFSELGLVDDGSVSVEREKEEAQKRNLSLADLLNLKGMDRIMLASLIKLTYAGITKDQANQFADGVIKNLSGANSESDVVTLFAIETLNVISDPQFYRRNPGLPRLIEPLSGKNRYCVKEPEKVGLTRALDSVFRNLNETYEASYLNEIVRTAGAERFNLASYAVLEERLHLIEQYFGDSGGTARYTLLLSAVLGNPFQRGLVKYALQELRQLLPEQCLALAPFLRELQSQVRGHFDYSHYELLERAYEVIRRLEEGTEKYVHQHSLMRQFLLGRFTQVLERTSPDAESVEEVVAALVHYVGIFGAKWFEELPNDDTSELSSAASIDLEQEWFYLAVTEYWYRVMICRSTAFGEWVEAYISRLNRLASVLYRLDRPEEALQLIETARFIEPENHGLSSERWVESHASSLNTEALIYCSLGRHTQAVDLLEKAVAISHKRYKQHPDKWGEKYATVLSNLVNTLTSLHSRSMNAPLVDDRLKVLAKEVLAITRRGFQESPKYWAPRYRDGLCTWGDLLESFNPEESLRHYDEALQVLERWPPGHWEDWAQERSTTLQKCVGSLQLEGRIEDARSLLEESSLLEQRLYENNPKRWAKSYVSSLMSRASLLKDEGRGLSQLIGRVDRAEEGLLLVKEALSVVRGEYAVSPQSWASIYASCLNLLSYILTGLGHKEDAFEVDQEALSVQRQQYKVSPEYWWQVYRLNLLMLSDYLETSGRLGDALPLRYEMVSVTQDKYNESTGDGAKFYTDSLKKLASLLEKSERPKDALSVYVEEKSVQLKRYNSSPTECAWDYFESLYDFAVYLFEHGRREDALPVCDEAVSVMRKRYSDSLKEYAKDHIKSLQKLADLLNKYDHIEKALSLYVEIVSIARDWHHWHEPTRSGASKELLQQLRWSEITADALITLASRLEQSNRLEDAFPLYKEALPLLRQLTLVALRRGHAKQTRRQFVIVSRHLVCLLEKLGREGDALSVCYDELTFFREDHKKNPKYGADNLIDAMDHLVCKLNAAGRSGEAMTIEREAKLLLRPGGE